MVPSKFSPAAAGNVLAIIMGGGQGSRLFPLTMQRSKPAVPLAGKYRLVDIPISNCINSGIKRMYLLTMFNSVSLHRHISQSYKFDHFTGGFVELLAAQRTYTDSSWYEGTADAVRKNIGHFFNHDFDYALILSGDQLYRMDYRLMIGQHLEMAADITVATIPVVRKDAQSLGIMQIDTEGRIVRFVEKPQEPAVLDSLRLDREAYAKLGIASQEELFLASMGIYVFNRDVLLELMNNTLADFGKHVIPSAIDSHRVFSYVFQGYWEDIGNIRSFFEANLDQTSDLPKFNFFDMGAPIFTRPRFLPASKINGGELDHAIISDGCIITDARIHHSVVGVRTVINPGCELTRTVALGCDFYESAASIAQHRAEGKPAVGIGRNTRLENAIIDKNARIGENCVITPAGKPENADHALYFIRDGIVVIPKAGIIPNGTVI